MNTAANIPLKLFFDQLRYLYSLEVLLSESMPRLFSLCTNEDLCDLLLSHAHQNCAQIAEIFSIFERYGESPGDDTCKEMAGLIERGTAHLEQVRSPHTRDLMMIAHCLRVEYYEIGTYKFTALLSGRLRLMREPVILIELLTEEKDMAAALMQLEPDIFETANS